MSRVDEVSQQIVRMLERGETVHLRLLLQRLPYGLREIKRALARLEAEGKIESFRHGGYTFYRLAGRGEEGEEEWSWPSPAGAGASDAEGSSETQPGAPGAEGGEGPGSPPEEAGE